MYCNCFPRVWPCRALWTTRWNSNAWWTSPRRCRCAPAPPNGRGRASLKCHTGRRRGLAAAVHHWPAAGSLRQAGTFSCSQRKSLCTPPPRLFSVQNQCDWRMLEDSLQGCALEPVRRIMAVRGPTTSSARRVRARLCRRFRLCSAKNLMSACLATHTLCRPGSLWSKDGARCAATGCSAAGRRTAPTTGWQPAATAAQPAARTNRCPPQSAHSVADVHASDPQRHAPTCPSLMLFA